MYRTPIRPGREAGDCSVALAGARERGLVAICARIERAAVFSAYGRAGDAHRERSRRRAASIIIARPAKTSTIARAERMTTSNERAKT